MEQPDVFLLLLQDSAVELGERNPFVAIFRAAHLPLTVSDPRQHDNPVVFVNDAFLQLVGYSREEVLHRNCRLLQGPETSEEAIAAVREAVAAAREIDVDLINYRKDGSKFWNALHISPIHNAAGELLFLFAVQRDITAWKEQEQQQKEFEIEARQRMQALQRALDEQQGLNDQLAAALQAKDILVHEADHRVKNNLQMISSLLAMQGRNTADPCTLASLAAAQRRVETLAAVHHRLQQSDDAYVFDALEFARELVTDLVKATGRADITTRFELEAVEFHSEDAAAVGLIINELVTNALKHAFSDDRPGTILLRIARHPEHVSIVVADDGLGMASQPPATTSFGSTLVKSLCRQLNGTVIWSSAEPGTSVEVRLMIGGVAAGE